MVLVKPDAQVEILESIGLIPHPSDPNHPPIEPYISDILPDLVESHDWLGVMLAIFEADSGLSDHPQPPVIYVYRDEDTGRRGLPMSADPVSSMRDAEQWLEQFWLHPRRDFNVNRLAPQLVLSVDDKHYLAVTIEMERIDFAHLAHNELWNADLTGMDEESAAYRIIEAVARDYMSS